MTRTVQQREGCGGGLGARALGLVVGVVMALASFLADSAPARAQAQFNALQPIGCYMNTGDKRLWIAAMAIDPKYKEQNFYEDNEFAVRIRVGEFKGEIDGKDILVHPMKAFNYKGAEKYQFLKLSLVVDYSSSIPDTVRTDVLNLLDKFVGKMPLAVETQLVRFATKVEKFPFTSNLGDVRAQLKQPIHYGMTALHDALMESITGLVQQGSATPVRLVVLFTDGRDTSSETYKERNNFIASFTSMAKSERIAVAAIGVTNDRDEELMRAITDRSRGITGLYLPIQDFNQLNKALEQVEHMVNNVVIYRMPNVGPNKGRAEIAMGVKTKGGSFNTFQTFDCDY